MDDRLAVLLLVAQVFGFPIIMPVVARAFNMYISTMLYCCLANYILLFFGFYPPLDLAAYFLNLLGNFLANFTGAWPRDFPDVFYGSGYGYEDDAGEYCWYLLGWVWNDNEKFLCCVLFGLVAILVPLNLNVAKKVRALKISNDVGWPGRKGAFTGKVRSNAYMESDKVGGAGQSSIEEVQS